MTDTFQPTWDLDVIFPGGSKSSEFQNYLKNVEKRLQTLSGLVKNLVVTDGKVNVHKFTEVVNYFEKTMKQFRESSAFISCLSAQDVNDDKANLLVGRRSELSAKMSTIKTNFDQILVQINNHDWQELLKQPEIEEISFILDEYRIQAKEKLALEQETLMNDLSIDGYQGWSQMYDTIVGKMNIHIKEDGEIKEYSVGQAANLLNHPNRSFRKCSSS